MLKNGKSLHKLDERLMPPGHSATPSPTRRLGQEITGHHSVLQRFGVFDYKLP